MISHDFSVRAKIKSETDRFILKTIYDFGPLSRAEIARKTKLTPPTVSSSVTKLIDEGLLRESEPVTNGRGKPATQISVIDNACSIIGVDISNREFQGAIFDIRGRLIYSINRLVVYEDQESIFAELTQLIDALLKHVRELGTPLLGIGIGTPGLLNVKDGSVQLAVNLGWYDFPLREKVESRYKVPVYVFNDSQAAALGQFTFDNVDNAQNLVVLKVGRGISAGIIIDGKIYSGSQFGASEIGHLQIVEDGALCQCGNVGCLETVASSLVVVQKVRELVAKDPSAFDSKLNLSAELTTEDILNLFHEGNGLIDQIIQQAGRYIGIAVASFIGILNISNIVIAGSLSRFGTVLMDGINEEIEKRVLSHLAEATNLRLSNLGQEIVMQGAASVILHHELGVI